MKRKIFSKLLMGALLVASVSSFVSCKDYDDDIKDLQVQIDKAALESRVSAMETTLTNAADAAKSAAAAAQKSADDALTKANDAATKAALDAAISDVKAAAEKAGQETAASIKAAADAAAAAQATANQGVADAATAQATANQGVADAAAAKAAADVAQAAAEKAQKTADDLASTAATKAEVETAKQAAIDAAAAAVKAADYATKADVEAATKAAAEAAQKAQENAVAAAATDAAAKYVANDDALKAKLSYIADMQAQYATASTLLDDVKAVKTDIATLKSLGDMTETVAKINSYDASFEELYTAVTSVELYYTSGAAYNGNWTKNLIFTEAIEKENLFPATPIEGAGQFEFKEGRPSVYGDSIVIRVSPVNAQLNANQIQLINSKGEDLSAYVEVVKVRPYGVTDNEILTRGTSNNGLWLVEFNLKDGVKTNDLLQASTVDYGLPTQNDIRYAVKVTNTANAEERGVISAYNLCMLPAQAQYVWDFSVWPATDDAATSVAQIYNRYTHCEDADIRTEKVPELVWCIVSDESGVYHRRPDTKATETNSTNRPDLALTPWSAALWNPYSRVELTDNRQDYTRLTVGVNEEITIEFPAYLRIKGFYVTLDNDFALESNPSEIEAWNSYSYVNVGTKTQKATLFKGNKGTIKVTSEAAAGDVIGFRVYAVHLDGTLYDPDGRAFYISIPGVNVEPQNLIKADENRDIVAYWHGDDNADYVTDFIELETDLFSDLVNSAAPWNFTGWTNDEDNVLAGMNSDVVGNETGWQSYSPYTVYFYDKNKNFLTTNPRGYFNRDNIANAKYIKISVPYSQFIRYVDGETYKQHIIARETRTQIEIKDFTVEFKKVMPGMPVDWEDFYFSSQINSNVFNFYPMAPTAAGTPDNWAALFASNWATKAGQEDEVYNGGLYSLIDASAAHFGVYYPVTYGDSVNAAIAGTKVGLDLNKVFNPKFIEPVGGLFEYTPDDSYSTYISTYYYKEELKLPNTFKMTIDGVPNSEYDFSANAAPHRYDFTKLIGSGDEFDLISHTKADAATGHDTKITYTYQNISTRKENGIWVVAGDYEVTDAPYSFVTRFVDPFAEPTQATASGYSFSTKYAKKTDGTAAAALDLIGTIDLSKFTIKGQYLNATPYTQTLKAMLANNVWKIYKQPICKANNGIIYYYLNDADDIAATGLVKLYAKFVVESGRPNAQVTNKVRIPLVNILGGKYTFEYNFNMARE